MNPFSMVKHTARWALAGAMLCLAVPAQTHEVVNAIQRQQAVTVTLQYSDGEPFSYETYELYAGQDATPVQTGRTDLLGRVVFLPGEETAMRLRAFSADGHGVDLRFEVPPALPAGATGEATAAPSTLNRPAKLLIGLAAILALFAGWQLFARQRSRT